MRKEREKWNKQREEFKKLQNKEGKKLDSIKCDIATIEDFARRLYGQKAVAEKEVRCLLDHQISAKADSDRIVLNEMETAAFG